MYCKFIVSAEHPCLFLKYLLKISAWSVLQFLMEGSFVEVFTSLECLFALLPAKDQHNDVLEDV
jgi:hypothetical protein